MTKSQTAKSTIRNDPFATVIPLPSEPTPTEFESAEPERNPVEVVRKPRAVNSDSPKEISKKETLPAKRGKQKLTVHLDPLLAERVKNAAYWNPRLTIAAIAEQGIKLAIEKCEREHGGKYPQREGELVGGRPIK